VSPAALDPCLGAQSALDEKVRALGADSVYMFLHPGWHTERRANRWHFAKRWSRHLPTTLVLPEDSVFPIRSKLERRLPNCRVLSTIPRNGIRPDERLALQFAQIFLDIQLRKRQRPILWLYNPDFVESFAALPAALRVHHATENYFDFPGLQSDFLERLKNSVATADLTVAVSDGCAEPLRPIVDPSRLMVVTNGCDFKEYAQAQKPIAQISALRTSAKRIAVFAGGVNDRLDFELIRKVSDAFPETLQLFVGDANLTSRNAETFNELRARANVHFLGPVDPDSLPGIYQASDAGYIPYVQERLIVENGFPLKALEMAATGLPVVTTFMRPLLKYCPPLSVASSHDEFLTAFGAAKKSETLTAGLKDIAAANDYDAKFEAIVDRLLSVGPRQTTAELYSTRPNVQPTLLSIHMQRLVYYVRVNALPRIMANIGRIIGLASKFRLFVLRLGKSRRQD